MCYTTIEIFCRHYRTREHKLTVLKGKVNKYDKRVDIPFPLETAEQKKLFKHLDYAYIGGRYKNETQYPGNQRTTGLLECRNKKLLKLTMQICEDKIKQLKEIEKANG